MQTYIEKNRGFVTSSKLKLFETCQWCYMQKYIKEIPDPYEEYETKDYFVIGQAFDDLITLGPDAWKDKYRSVDIRVDVLNEMQKAEGKIEAAQLKLNKNGSRSAKGLKDEAMAKIKIKSLLTLKDKVQLTRAMYELIESMEKEYRANQLFIQKPTKHVIEMEFGGLQLRSELDELNLKDRMIRDLKTCASVTTFRPDFYLLQMCFYNFMVEEKYGEKCEALLEVVDKNRPVSRSVAWKYRVPTLEDYRGQLIKVLSEMKEAHESGIFLSAKNPEILFNCPYYGLSGHGRPTFINEY